MTRSQCPGGYAWPGHSCRLDLLGEPDVVDDEHAGLPPAEDAPMVVANGDATWVRQAEVDAGGCSRTACRW